jgi:MarR family transcriptional regulator, transcriptional regulator for hemolysin
MQDIQWAKANGLGFLISDTARLLRKRFDQRAREVGLTRAQWQVLALLGMNEGINQAGLADILDIEPITLTRHLEKLEEAGLIERRSDPSDKRARTLFLTEAASPVIAKIRTIGRGLIEEMTAGLSAADIDAMRSGLQHLRNVLTDRSAEAPPANMEISLSKRKVQ